MSLRAKGFWIFIFFALFVVSSGLIIARERNTLHIDVQKLQTVHLEEEEQLTLNTIVARAIMVVNDYDYAHDRDADVSIGRLRVAVEIEAVLSGMKRQAAIYPAIAAHMEALQQNLAELTGPTIDASLTKVRGNLHRLVIDLGAVTAANRNKEAQLLVQYSKTSDRLSLEWALFTIIGVIVLGSLVMIFVTRLAWDIRRVQDRALQIVEGYRGAPLEVTRHDELGSLMEGVNQMQHELRQRELQVELIRQQQFHKEKMAAVGSLAAAVAHEINNPLSAIVGLAQGMSDMRAAQQCGQGNDTCQPDVLQAQARRVMDITRQIFEFSVPRSAEPELLDLNSLVRNTARFVSFDRRFRFIDLVLTLDPQLPALYVVGDHITQVLMNLLINAADATEGRTEPRPRIVLSTRANGDAVLLTVADNGIGMEPAVRARVFEQFFTTKSPGRGSGIGLSVSKSLIEDAGGSIGIESEPGAGTTVTIKLPVRVEETSDRAEAFGQDVQQAR